MAGVSFVDGDTNLDVNSTNDPSAGMQSGGPVDVPDDYKGRSAGMNVGNFEGTPQRGGSLDSPVE